MTDVLDKPQWVIVGPGELRLMGTRFFVEYRPNGSTLCFHVHLRSPSFQSVETCFGCAPSVEIAKGVVLYRVKELLDMGIEP